MVSIRLSKKDPIKHITKLMIKPAGHVIGNVIMYAAFNRYHKTVKPKILIANTSSKNKKKINILSPHSIFKINNIRHMDPFGFFRVGKAVI